MSGELVVILMFGGLLLGILSGFPIAFVMLGISLILGYIGLGIKTFPLIVTHIFGTMSSYILAAIPLFIFMGYLLQYSSVANRAILALRDLLRSVKGGLLIAVIVIGVFLATCTGVVGSSVTLLGILVLPTLMQKNYDKALSVGSICAAGTLGIFIPPSIMLVMYGPMAGISVVNLFQAAFLPGFILAGLYILYIIIRCKINPSLAPYISLDESSENQKLSSFSNKIRLILTDILPIGVISFAVLGSILFGVAAVTEAAAAGGVATLILVAVYKELNLKMLKKVAIDTLKVSSMIFFITFAAHVFTGVFMMLGGERVLISWLGKGLFPEWIVVLIMMFTFFILGFFMDWIGIVPLLVPIYSQIISQLGINPLWFAIMACINMQTSFLTPPLAPTLFYIKAIAPPEIDFLKHIVKGVIPFVFIQLIALVLFYVFPNIILFVPELFLK